MGDRGRRARPAQHLRRDQDRGGGSLRALSPRPGAADPDPAHVALLPEADDRDDVRGAYADANLKVNELLYRRVDLEDATGAHLLALERALELGFGRYIISATTPFTPADLAQVRDDAPAVVRRLHPEYVDVYAARGWRMFDGIERVYVNERARRDLGWEPRYDFAYALERLAAGEEWRSELALSVGAKGYHAQPTGPYTT